MTVYKVFEIGEEIHERIDITTEMENNIETIISSRIEQNLEGNSVSYQLENQESDHFIYEFNHFFFELEFSQEELENKLKYLASKLLISEQTKDPNGVVRRKKNITAGILFIKYTNRNLTLLKLESLEIIDRDTFEPKKEYSTERDYFKLAIINKNELNDIRIVDRNKKIAKYWAEEFLELNRVRDSYRNTEELLSHIKHNNFFRVEVFQSEQDFNRANKKIKNIIFEGEYHFNKEDFFQSLIQDTAINFIDDIHLDELYTPEVNTLDEDFQIDRSLVYQEQSKKIKVSDEVTIDIKNFKGQKMANAVKLENNIIKIRIDEDLLEDIQTLFEDE